MELTFSPQYPASRPEVRESESCYFFRFPLPGVELANELDVELVDNELIVSRISPGADTGPSCSFVFPRGIEAEVARAVWGHGELRLVVPKRSFTKHRKVTVETEDSGFWSRLIHGMTRAGDRGECL